MTDPFNAQHVNQCLRGACSTLAEKLPSGFPWCVAILDTKGELIHVDGTNTLHFTAFEAVVKSMKTYFNPKINEVFITNDPYSGNTRLSDLMLIQGAFGTQAANELRYYVAVQISIPQIINKEWKNIFSSVEEEGFRIPPSPLDQGGLVNPAILEYISQSGISTDSLSQILGQVKVALKKAAAELIQSESGIGREKFHAGIEALRKYSESQVRKALHEIPDGDYEAQDFLDNDGVNRLPVKLQCQLHVQGESVLINFSGSSKQTTGPFNCNYPLTLGACFAVLRGFVKVDVPVNSGSFRAFSVEAQEGTIVNAAYPHALLGGYFETTLRITDVLKTCLSKALPHAIPSQSGGSLSPTLMKFEGEGKKGTVFFDTLGYGAGAGYAANGTDCLKPDFDNFPAPSIEDLEKKLPIQVIQNSLRDSAHGDGKNQGGRGLTRGYKFLKPTTLMLLADRHTTKIQGFFGGISGLHGEAIVFKSGEKKKSDLGKMLVKMGEGDTLFISSPSGAGWGKADKEKESD